MQPGVDAGATTGAGAINMASLTAGDGHRAAAAASALGISRRSR